MAAEKSLIAGGAATAPIHLQAEDVHATAALIHLADVALDDHGEERKVDESTALVLYQPAEDVDATALLQLADVAHDHGEFLGEKDENVYPHPLHSHEEVLRDRSLFMESLRRFHSSMKTKFVRVPVLGGKTLDLHLLYTEVTRRGGIEKVIAEKKWRDVVAAFEFPASATSASFAMRRYYMSLLYHYEQVHFFYADGPLITPSVAALILHRRMPTSDSRRKKGKGKGKGKGKKRAIPDDPPHEDEDSHFQGASGSIDAKYEYGYMVRMRIKNENLCGMLYRCDRIEGAPNSSTSLAITSAAAIMPSPVIGAAPERSYSDGGASSSHNPIRRRQTKSRLDEASQGRRRRSRKADPMHPKANRSGYNFFFSHKCFMMQTTCGPGKKRGFCKMIGETWKKLTDDERKVYENQALEDKWRYKKEKLEYKRKLKLGLQEA